MGFVSNRASCMLNKRFGMPFTKCSVLFVLSMFVLVAVSGHVKSIEAVQYIRQRSNHPSEKFLSDFSNEVAFILKFVKPKVLELCPKGFEHYVPCYNITRNLEAGFTDGKEFDRHCNVSKLQKHCLWPSPKDYRLPLKWPSSKDMLWSGNVKIAGHRDSLNRRNLERTTSIKENKITFVSRSDGSNALYNYICQIRTMITLGKETSFSSAGIQTALDFASTYGSLGAHLLSENVLTMSVAPYEVHGGQVQIALERGLPAMITSFKSVKLPFPRFAFDMVLCYHCGTDWNQKEGVFIIEVDRILRAGGYFVWTRALSSQQDGLQSHQENSSKMMEYVASRLCWNVIAQQEDTFVWQKSALQPCFSSWNCEDGAYDLDAIWYEPLNSCIMKVSPSMVEALGQHSRANENYAEPSLAGLSTEKDNDVMHVWLPTLNEIWSLLTPLIFSDHPKRPGDEDPKTPFNVVRNVMDMNAPHGRLNAALSQGGKSVWVMNVVPTSGLNTLPAIFRQGFLGVLHDWCEAFPTYPRSYDMLYAANLLSQESRQQVRCKISSLLLEMDRILRPEGWILLQDDVKSIEEAREAAAQMQWETRVVEVAGEIDQRLLVCQKGWRS